MMPLTAENIELLNNQKLCHNYKKKFHDVDDSNDNSTGDRNDDDSNDDEMMIRL